LFSGLSPENNKHVNLCDLCGFAVKKIAFVENPAGYLIAQFKIY